jgi:hypothetical protein
MGTIKIALTNLGQYNEGLLNFTWLELPATEEEIAEAMKKIDIGAKRPDGGVYEEFFITDYECDFLNVGEYDNIDELNETAEALDDLDDYEETIVKALLDDGYTLEDALDQKDDCRLWDTDNMELLDFQGSVRARPRTIRNTSGNLVLALACCPLWSS